MHLISRSWLIFKEDGFGSGDSNIATALSFQLAEPMKIEDNSSNGIAVLLGTTSTLEQESVER